MRPTPEQIRHDLHEVSEMMWSMEAEDKEPDAIEKAVLAEQLAFLVLMIRRRYKITSTYWIASERQTFEEFRRVYGAIDDD